MTAHPGLVGSIPYLLNFLDRAGATPRVNVTDAADGTQVVRVETPLLISAAGAVLTILNWHTRAVPPAVQPPLHLHVSVRVELKAEATRVDSVALGKPIKFTCTPVSDVVDDNGKTTFVLGFSIDIVYGDFVRIIAAPPTAAPVTQQFISTLSTPHLAIEFDGVGVVTAVRDRATGRNLVLAAGRSTEPQFSLVSAVFTANDTALNKAATSPTKVTYDQGAGLITASFANGAVVPVGVNITSDGMIIFTILASGAHVEQLSDVLFLTTPLKIGSCAAGPVAAFDERFALVLLPGSLQTMVMSAWNEAWGTPLDPAGHTPHWAEPFSSCNASATGVILRAHASAAVGGIVGRSAALWGGPPAQLDAAIQRGEALFGLPSPTIDGHWSKRAPNAKKGYFLISVTPDALTTTIELAQQSGMEYITLLDNIWGRFNGGHYNFSSVWGGMDGMKKAVVQINAAGLKAGMHTMSGNICKEDPYVTPIPDPRLDKRDVNALGTAVDAKVTWLPLARPTAGMPSPNGPHLYAAATDCLIDSEIISYAALNASGLGKVTRGAYGTVAAPHVANATVWLLTQVYGGFLPDPATDMVAEIGANMARAYKEAGMSMVYFDGLEAHSHTGPACATPTPWCGVGVAESMLHQSFFNELQGHDALVESSDSSRFLWHLNTRTGQTDWAATDRRAFLDYTKGPNMRNAHCSSLDTPDMGWWGFLDFAPGQYLATTPDECEYMASRAVGWDAAPNFETEVTAFQANGRTAECLALIKPWLSLGERVPESVKSQLHVVGVDYKLENSSDGKYYVRPGKAHAPAVADAAVPSTLRWTLPSAYPAATGDATGRRVGVRLRALSAVPKGGNTIDLLQLTPGSGAVRNSACLAAALNYSVSHNPPAGAPAGITAALQLTMSAPTTSTTQCARTQFAAPLDLSTHRVVEYTIHSDGSGAVLNIQVQCETSGVREYFVTLNFSGWRTIRPPMPATRMLYTHGGGAIPYASLPGGNDNRAMREFEWGKVIAVNFELTNVPKTATTVFVGQLHSLEERAASTETGATLTVGGAVVPVPLLRGGTQADQADYVECVDVSKPASCVAYDANNWVLNHTIPVSTNASNVVTVAATGEGAEDIDVQFKSGAGAAARVEVVVFEWGSDAARLGPF
jgi:hypothetical protein